MKTSQPTGSPPGTECTRCAAREREVEVATRAWTSTALKLTELSVAVEEILQANQGWIHASPEMVQAEHLLRTWGVID
jgi:hypothetical protein